MDNPHLLNDLLVGKSFLTLKNHSEEEIHYLIDLAAELKAMKKKRIPHRYLEGQNIALLFEKPSTRTRCAFTVACVDLGAHPEYLGKQDVQFGKKNPPVIRPSFLAACLMESGLGDSNNRLWRPLQNMRESRCGMD